MTTRINGIPNCDTVKKARAWLKAEDVDHAFRDFKKDAPRDEEIARWADAVSWEVLLNRRGTTFRKLDEADRADMTRDKAIALMVQHPSLIKRPVLEPADSDRVIVGFSPTEWENALC